MQSTVSVPGEPVVRQTGARALAAALEHAAHLLPSQAPIGGFVHHNTLHAFEDQPFERALLEAASLFGAEPYQSETAFADHLASGRILARDIEAIVAEECPREDELVFAGGPTRHGVWKLRLQHLFEVPQDAPLEWLQREADTLRRVHPAVSPVCRARLEQAAGRSVGGPRTAGFESLLLQRLWERLNPQAPSRKAAPPEFVRPRDQLLAAGGLDIDELVHPLLIRVCAAFLDQGVAYWTMPGRERGLWAAFRELYRRQAAAPDRWLSGMGKCLTLADDHSEAVILRLLDELGLPPARWEAFVTRTLLALPGWAGMIRQLEDRPQSAPVEARPAKLLDFLAVRLVLEQQALRFGLREHLGTSTELSDWSRLPARGAPAADRSVVYEAFVMAQLAGLGPDDFEDKARARSWIDAMAELDSLTRRRLLHLAYERRHRTVILDGLLQHATLGNSPRLQKPRLQAVFCIDDRQESLRRHLEETYPSAETFGFAGFFGVAMAYRGVADIRPQLLCPVVMTPKHLVVEEPVDPGQHAALANKQRHISTARNAARVGSRTLVRGFFSATTGLLSVIPLLGYTLWPRASERMAHALQRAVIGPAATRLRLERADDEGLQPDGYFHGFTVAEMARIVEAALRTISLTSAFAELVLIVGHGSSSLNNPLESAYDCGATGGGRGGPNARAFAQMANHPEVRRRVAQAGIAIPDETWFLGAYHDTCDDSLTYFDEDTVPERFLMRLAEVRAAFDRARELDAHERCRRFEAAPTSIPSRHALSHVEARSVDLGQPRPECGHATNAVCIVGRRERTRGLFLDRRAFLVSYDPTDDPTGQVLASLLQAVAPVGAGINLEYYFSYVDPKIYGAGTKLPHNVVGLIGIMDGHASDLRTGLPWEMVEIHEPVRLLTIIEAEPETLVALLEKHPAIARLVVNSWVQVVAWSPSSGQMSVYHKGRFVQYEPESHELPIVEVSSEHYRGQRDHLACARVRAGMAREA